MVVGLSGCRVVGLPGLTLRWSLGLFQRFHLATRKRGRCPIRQHIAPWRNSFASQYAKAPDYKHTTFLSYLIRMAHAQVRTERGAITTNQFIKRRKHDREARWRDFCKWLGRHAEARPKNTMELRPIYEQWKVPYPGIP